MCTLIVVDESVFVSASARSYMKSNKFCAPDEHDIVNGTRRHPLPQSFLVCSGARLFISVFLW